MADVKKTVPGKYIDPFTDFGFKRLLGSEPNKDLLIDFLNAVFEGRKKIVDIVYIKNEYLGETKSEGAIILDIACITSYNEIILIEVQRGRPGNFKKRSVFYSSRIIAEQAPKGRRAEWGYDIKEVYLIAVLEDFTLSMVKDGRYLYNVNLTDRLSGKVFYEGLEFIFIELVNFAKVESELATDLDKWLYVLKNMSKMDKLPTFLRKPVFVKLFNLAAYANLKKEEKTMYNTSLKRRWDNKAVLDYAVREAAKNERASIARELLKEGLSVEFIAKTTGLATKEIDELKADLNK